MNAQLLEWSVRAILMAAATAAILTALRVRSGAARHAAWTAVVAAMLLMPVWSVWGPELALPVLPPADQAVFEPAFLDSPALELTPSPVTAARSEIPALPQPERAWPWSRIVLGCYLLGVAAMLTRLALGTLHARSLLRHATGGPEIFTSPGCAAPVTIGWLRPSILLPADWREWPAAELDAVLIHEREHARRRDPLVQWLALLNRAIFWFHPLAWWLERHLARLAEDACDAAVLRRGHDPAQYSEYLIGFARAIHRAGGRLPSWGAAMGGGTLAARIDRILTHAPLPSLSRRKAAAAAILCGIGLLVFAACNVGRQDAPLSMNEMARREAVQREAKAAENKALLDEAQRMTPEQAAAKLAALQASPQNDAAHFQLMRYYDMHSDLKGKIALILWYIEHAPNGKVHPWNISPAWDRAAYEQGKRMWLAHVKDPGATADTYDRAGAFLQGADKSTAEEIILAGRQAFPQDTRWARVLGAHYAGAVAGASEPRSEYNVIHGFTTAEALSPYARSVRAKLESSTDAEVLAQTAQWLMSMGRDARTPSDTMELARSLADRAVAVDPANQLAALIRFRIGQRADMVKQLELRKLAAEQQQQLGDADRLLLLRDEMDRAWGPVGKNPDLDLTAAKARELLALAQRVPGVPHASFVPYQANFMLGKVALRKGDKSEAAKYLLAAADAPASEDLRHDPIMMNLPRALVDWGERDAVAQFLDRVAEKSYRSKELKDWAAQLRKGENPNLIPTMIGCSQEPC